MSKRVKQDAVWERGKRSALRTWGLYLLSLTAWVTAVVALAVLGMVVCSSFIWYDTPLYRFLNWVRDYIFFVGMAVVLLGWVVISYFFIARPVRDLELLLAGAGLFGSDGTHIHHQRTGRHGVGHAVPEQHGVHNAAVGQDGEHDVTGLPQLLWGHILGALPGQARHRGGIQIVDCQRDLSPQKIFRHRGAHNAQADKADAFHFAHPFYLFALPPSMTGAGKMSL